MNSLNSRLNWKRCCTGFVLGLLVFAVLIPSFFVTPVSGSDWWDPSWIHRMKITFDNSAISENLTNFPMPIVFDGGESDFWSSVSSDGSDIRFVDSDSSAELYFELEQWDYSGNNMVAWVKVPQVSSGSTTDHIFIYYKNDTGVSSTEYKNSTQVWDSNYVAIWHLNQTSGTIYDATSNNNDATNLGAASTTSGKIGNAYDFEFSDNDYMTVADSNSLDITNKLTIEAWVKPEAFGTYWYILEKHGATHDEDAYAFLMNLDDKMCFEADVVTDGYQFWQSDTTNQFTANNWYLLTVVWDHPSSEVRFYKDGSILDTLSISVGDLDTTDYGIDVGRQNAQHPSNFDGILDELRISANVHSAEWIEACYQYQVDQSKIQFGSEETSQPAKLSVDPQIVEKSLNDVCTTFQANATIENVADLYAFDFNLTWDNTLITLVDVDFNTSLDNIWGPDSWFVAKNETGAGYYKLAAVSTSTGFNSTIPTALAILSFQVEPPMSNSISQTLIHFETHKLSDSIPEYIPHTTEDGTYQVTGKTPTLSMSLDKRICRTYHESFTVAVNASNIYNVEEFSCEIHYNTTLLNYVTTKLNAWNEGNITVQESNGIITGSTGGDLKTGNITLITITFHTSLYHIWKECTGWTNHLTGTIYFQWANLSYPVGPDLRYEKDVIYQIDVAPVEALHIFAPIQGDVDNDGNVDVFDLRTVAYYYDISDEDSNWTEASKYNLNCDGIIDNSDLEIVGDNFWFRYDPWQPYAYFVYSPLVPRVNETVTFNASQSISNEGSIENYEWHFDDSSQGNGRIVNHKYNNPGEYSVTLTVTDDQALTDICSRVVTVLPSRSCIDVYTQRNGKGLNKSSDAFAPDEYIKMTAYVTYDETPIPEKQVNFQLYLPNGTIVFNIANETDDNGLTSYSFLIPSDSVFGLYSITATASVAGEEISDTVWFKVGLLVEILDVIPCDEDGIAKNRFEREEQLYLQVKLQNICFDSKTVTLSVSVFDDIGQPILYYEEEYTVSPGQTTILMNPGSIPRDAYNGEATVYVLAMDPTGHSYCPMMLAHFYIVSSS